MTARKCYGSLSGHTETTKAFRKYMKLRASRDEWRASKSTVQKEEKAFRRMVLLTARYMRKQRQNQLAYYTRMLSDQLEIDQASYQEIAKRTITGRIPGSPDIHPTQYVHGPKEGTFVDLTGMDFKGPEMRILRQMNYLGHEVIGGMIDEVE